MNLDRIYEFESLVEPPASPEDLCSDCGEMNEQTGMRRNAARLSLAGANDRGQWVVKENLSGVGRKDAGHVFSVIGLPKSVLVAKRLECARFIAALTRMHAEVPHRPVDSRMPMDSGAKSPRSKRWRVLANPAAKPAPNTYDAGSRRPL